jgi:hypothetical protein
LEFLGEEQHSKTTIYTDSRSGLELMKTLKSHVNTNHINLRIHFIREILNNHQISLEFIAGTENPSDGLTKPLDGQKFQEFKRKLLNIRDKF